MSAKTFARATTFAQLPDPGVAFPADVPDQSILVTDVGPAPGIELISDGTIWRPRGGRQVLAMRTLNPVTVQDLAGAVAETIGPFPGGLVRAGMRLEMDSLVDHSGLGGGVRIARYRIGSGAVRNSWIEPNLSTSGSSQKMRKAIFLDVQSDVSAGHVGGISTPNSYTSAAITISPVVDFSVGWSADIFLQSAAETAVAISTATWAAGVATYNTSADSTLAVGDKTTIAGVDLAGYNGVVIVASVPTTTQFTAVIANPGGSGTGGTSSRISNMISQSYVLELVG